MKVEIPHKISNTHIRFFKFEVEGKRINYVGYMDSRRSDPKDTWGHLWEKKFGNLYEKLHENEEYKLAEENDDEYKMNEMYEELHKKINPIRNKTKHGFPYYSGCYFGHNKEGEYKKNPIPWTKEELKAKVLKAIGKQLE